MFISHDYVTFCAIIRWSVSYWQYPTI